MREFRPHVVTTYDENGGYPHPDHIMCHKVSVEAYHAAGDADRYPEAGRALAAAEALLQPDAVAGRRIQAFHDAMLAAGLESPYAEWIARLGGARRAHDHHARCRAGRTSSMRDQALLAHATQVDPEGTWFAVPLEMQLEVWPTEDYRAGP